VFEDPGDPMVNWTAESLRDSLLRSVKDISVQLFPEISDAARRIPGTEVERWFRAGGGGRSSLGDRLRKLCGETEFETIRETVHAQLADTEAPWKTAWCFFEVKRKK
jgi:hypothetical protein